MPTSEAASLATSTASNAIAMLEKLRKARALLDGCHDLLFADLETVPDNLLREVTNDIFEIREIAGEIYEPIAFQIAETELADLEADDAAGLPLTETGSQQVAGAQDGEAVDIFGKPVPSVSTMGTSDARAQAEALLRHAYGIVMSRIRNKGREQPADTEYRDSLLADFRARVAAMSDEDRAYFEQLEARYRDRAVKLQERVNAMLKFWNLPQISSVELQPNP